ncbi:MAG: hypothetical protein M3548_24305 [Actinomycetota bacterium]|nr:hypothetical protein [Actinomycetota bacterium]
MDDTTYVLFLVLGVALVLADGMIIYRSAVKYLGDSYADEASARSMARLVAVLFHLAVLGVIALISALDFGGDSPLQALMIRLGIVLIILAIAHGVAIKVLTRMRDRLDAENLTKHHYEHTAPQAPAAAPVTPSRVIARERQSRAAGRDSASPQPPTDPDLQQPRGAVTPEIR